MTKEEFMQSLEQKLSGVPEEEKAYFMRYCREMIEDRMEEGISEEEAVGTQEELDAAVQAFMRENGYAQISVPGKAASEDVGAWSLAAASVRSVFIDVSNIRIISQRSDTGKIEMTYPVDEDRLVVTRELTSDGVMHLRIRGRERKVLFGLFSWAWVSGQPDPVTLRIPSDFAGEVRLKTANASVLVEHGGTAGDLTVETSNARIGFGPDFSQAGRIRCRTNNGKIEYGNLQAQEIELTTSNGRIEGSEAVTAGKTVLNTSNGPIRAGSIRASEIVLSTSNARIGLDYGDAGTVTLTTSNGGIHAKLAGSIRDYGVESSTSHGDTTLPSRMKGGDRQLKAVTSNGSIKVSFEND